jgi:hypothetical protein
MGKRSAVKPDPHPDGPVAAAPTPTPGRAWPAWACWLVSAVLLFHITAIVVCEVAGQVVSSTFERDLARPFWWYPVMLHQEIAHAYFAPEPDPATPIVTARLEYSGRQPDRVIRLPDPATRPRIRYLREIGLAWHVVHEWSQTGPVPRSYWAASYARHLCRTNPGCTRVALYMQYHRMPDPASVVRDVSRGTTPVLDAPGLYTVAELIGAFSCDEF